MFSEEYKVCDTMANTLWLLLALMFTRKHDSMTIVFLQVLQEMSPKHPVEACIRPDNKQRNRYANIHCCEYH